MKKSILMNLLVLSFTISSSAQDLPQPSPKSKLEQRVGLTDITIEYSRPSVKGRKIFGELVPYGELWRTGANLNTTVEFSTPIIIQNELIEAGKYSLITIPSEDNWVIIFNKNTENWGTFDYNEEADRMRIEVGGEKYGEFVETFVINVGNIANESAEIQLIWDRTKISIPFEVEVKELAEQNIQIAIELADEDGRWRVYRNAASYYYNNKTNLEKAMYYMEESLNSKDDNWYSYWLYAQILAELGDYRNAINYGEEAINVRRRSMGKKKRELSYQEMMMTTIEKWEEMAGK